MRPRHAPDVLSAWHAERRALRLCVADTGRIRPVRGGGVKVVDNLEQILALHKKWADGVEGGVRANLVGADLQRANLRGADLQGANLWGANLRGVDLQGANLDFSDWPLWCGSLDARVDRGIAAQLAYHFCRLDCGDPEYLAARDAIRKFANTFHRVDECGRIAHESHKD